jgi:hypothetical protein
MKYCYCKGCNYSQSHITSYHRCGACKRFGHGLKECPKSNNGSYDLLNDLCIKFNHSITEGLPSNIHCSVNGCLSKDTHTTGSHEEFFSKDKHGSLSGPDQYGITARRKDGETDGRNLVKSKPGTFTNCYWGMGILIITRNLNGVISVEDIDCTDKTSISKFTKGLTEI